MEIVKTVLSFLVAITILVGVHEMGHFLVAKFFRVKVLVFSIGFGRALWSSKCRDDQTKFSIGVIPLGGYVRMLDESDKLALKYPSETFSSKSAGQKILISLAGPVANFILTLVLFFLIFSLGPTSTSIKPILGAPQTDSLLHDAGISGGDLVLQINNRKINSWADIQWELTRLDSELLDLEILPQGVGSAESHTIELGANSYPLNWDSVGIRPPKIDLLPKVGVINKQGTAYQSDLRVNDLIVSVQGTQVSSWSDLVEIIRSKPGEEINLGVKRVEEFLQFPLKIGVVEGDIGQIGISPHSDGIIQRDLIGETNSSSLTSITKALQRTHDLIIFTLKMIVGLIAGEVGLNNLAGPIGIADQAGKTAELGLLSYLSFLAVLSVSLGVINLFPLPMLDGGHIVFHLYELILGKKLPERVIVKAQQIGMICLLGLMFFVISNDLSRYLGI
ncbi:RIP metalloprotease RseP [Burkholderiales bacterium]|mgnify:FL=1|nr:RIP metalloprotease RseP [Betaproteobacteria bacterium]MDA9295459.1 RIP metalloprotease RseP [Burkholderiales bacterium]